MTYAGTYGIFQGSHRMVALIKGVKSEWVNDGYTQVTVNYAALSHLLKGDPPHAGKVDSIQHWLITLSLYPLPFTHFQPLHFPKQAM